MSKEQELLQCAHTILETVPRLSRMMRKDLRLHSAGLFTEPQFRVMAMLFREGAQCLSDLADYQGVSLPTMSKLVQGLEARGLVAREQDAADRRRIVLTLTPDGRSEYAALLRHTEEHIVEWIQSLTPAQRQDVIQVFAVLDELFAKVEFSGTVLA